MSATRKSFSSELSLLQVLFLQSLMLLLKTSGHPEQGKNWTLLAAAKTLVVEQQTEMLEAIVGWETQNSYQVKNEKGEIIFLAKEKSSWQSRLFLGSVRVYDIDVVSLGGPLAFEFNKNFQLIFHRMRVKNDERTILGSIQQRFAFFNRVFSVYDPFDREVFRIIGPFWNPWKYRILRHGVQVGEISKKWSGFMKEYFTDADKFALQFPAGIDLKQKGLLLGALFLIDMTNFENNEGRR